MIKLRLLGMLRGSIKYVFQEVILKWLSLLAQIILIGCVSRVISETYYQKLETKQLIIYIAVALFSMFARLVFDRLCTEAAFAASTDVKRVLRNKIYSKLIRLGSGYRQHISSAQITQMMGEGVEQLEIYFGKYISQFVYALIAPLTLFGVLSQYNLDAALVLIIAVPLIPMVIMIVTKVARKLLDKYFQIYYGLGDTFLEKLNGMTTLKIYGADEEALISLDKESEQFRKITMKVLSLQLNSTIIMDIIAYMGAAIGIVVSLSEYSKGNLNLDGAIMFLLLSAEFFLPMRLLGSYFHMGMNGMKAADKMFEFMDIREPQDGKGELKEGPYNILIKDLSFAYDNEVILNNINIDVNEGQLISIVGVSGSGKSTIAKLIRKQNEGYKGTITIGGKNLRAIKEEALMEVITCVSTESFIFYGTVRDNLLLGNEKASDKKLFGALKLMNLLNELEAKGGLDYMLEEGGANLSKGQCQRLVLARALLKNSPIYIFDEATNNIDMESEEIIMKVIRKLSKDMGKTIILISHRLANVVTSNEILLLSHGQIMERGTHKKLMGLNGEYAKLYNGQIALENYGKGEA